MENDGSKTARNRRFSRLRRALVVACLGLIAAVPVVGATEFGGDDVYELAEGDTTDGNLYVGGQTVTINGTVDGDLIAGGTTVVVGPTGVVRGDMMAAGQSVIIRGTVEGDVRAAGFLVQAEGSASIGGELVAAGYSVGALESSSVEGTVMAAGYQGLIDGTLGGDLHFGGSALQITGRVEGDVAAAVDRSGAPAGPPMFMFPGQPALPRTAAPGFDVSEGEIGGSLTLQSPEAEPELDETRVGGSVETTEVAAPEADAAAEPERSPALEWILDWLKTSAALLIFGAAAVWLAPRLLSGSGELIHTRALPSTAAGCGTMLVAPVLLVVIVVATFSVMLLFGTLSLGGLNSVVISGAGLAVAFLTAGLNLLAWLARVALALWVGRWLLAKANPGMAGNAWVALLIGVLIYAALRHMPFIGFWIHVLWTGLGLGALLLLIWPRVRSGWWPAATAAAPGAA